MKSLILSFALIFSCLTFLQAADWTTDYQAALAKSKVENKPVLLDFTGSDWCGYCKLIDKEVFTTPAFKEYADKNLILVTIDFPRSTPLPAALKTQNDGLASQFSVDGFPTLLLVDSNGKELGREVGYDPGSGTTAVVGQLKGFVKK